MIASILMFWRRLMCRHVMDYDRLLTGAETLVVRVRCLRCGKLDHSSQPVRRKLDHGDLT